jgi:nitroreductase
MMTEESKKAVCDLAKIMRERQTCKVLGDPLEPVKFSQQTLDDCNAIVKEAIANAGWAPFHYDRGVDGIAEPWRAHFLGEKSCRHIAREFSNWFVDVKPTNKLPAMLSACGSLVLVTWLPQFRGDAKANGEELPPEKRAQVDDEHLSATAAMIQNLLLLLTAGGLGTYWSSGGQLGSQTAFDQLGISLQERLAGAIFVEYPNGSGPVVERVAGKNRSRRSAAGKWLTEK